MAREVGVSVASMHRILRNKLMVKPFKIHKGSRPYSCSKQMRHQRSKALKQRLVCGDLKNCVFTDEKVFTGQQFVNKQNDRVWLTERSAIDMDQLRAYRRQKPPSVTVLAGVTENGRTPLVFVPAGQLSAGSKKTFQPSFRRQIGLRARPISIRWTSPMDILESKVCNKKYDSVEVLKHALVREWNKIPQSVIRAACNAFADRLDTVILFKGGHIEN